MNRANQTDRSGALAQLVERLHGMQEVSGSTPLSSTIVTSEHRKVFGGTAILPYIIDPARPSLVWRSCIENGLYSETWGPLAMPSPTPGI